MIPLDMKDLPILGDPQPQGSGVDTPFWAALNAGELRVQRCVACRTWTWPPQFRCGECGSWDLAWEAAPPRGVVHSWTRNFQAFSPEWSALTPYVSLMVEVPEAGDSRFMGLLIGDEGALRIGATVEGVIQPPGPDGQAVLRWKLVDQSPGEH